MLFLSLLIDLCLTVDIAWCSLSLFPQNLAVIAGQTMAFECRTHNGSIVREWTLLRASSGEIFNSQQHLSNEKIFNNWNSGTKSTYLAQFSVDVDKFGSGTLYSNSTTLEDAGLYTCVIEIGHQMTYWSAQLIVFESTPFCETNHNTSTGNSFMEGDRIWMRCSVRFRGYWIPSMEWRQHGEDKDGRIIAADEVVENKNFKVTSMISITFNSSTNNSFFSCKTYFATQKSRRLANASNAPKFNHLWKSPEIKQTDSAHASVNTIPLTTTPLDSGFISNTNLYFVSLTAVGTLAAFFCIVTTILCIRMKRKSSDPVTLPANEVDRPISSGHRPTAVSRSSLSLYETIDDETMTTVRDTAYLSVLHSSSRTSSISSIHGEEKCDSVSLCSIQQIPVIDKGYENAEIWNSNQPFQTVLTLPNPDAEFPTPEGNYPPNLNSDTLQDNTACEDVSYIKVVVQVRGPAPYESLKPSTARVPNDHTTDVTT